MAEVRLSLSVSDSHLDRMDEVSEAAGKAGLRVEQKLGDIGVLIGTIEKSKIGDLHRIDGVAHVEEERRFDLAPPGSPVQ